MADNAAARWIKGLSAWALALAFVCVVSTVAIVSSCSRGVDPSPAPGPTPTPAPACLFEFEAPDKPVEVRRNGKAVLVRIPVRREPGFAAVISLKASAPRSSGLETGFADDLLKPERVTVDLVLVADRGTILGPHRVRVVGFAEGCCAPCEVEVPVEVLE